MQAATPWLLASITKLHIATVVLRLHERGVIDLDARVSAYLPPELARGLHVLDGVDHTERITPTRLLGHLTGLPGAFGERPRGGRSLLEEVLEDGDRAWTSEMPSRGHATGCGRTSRRRTRMQRGRGCATATRTSCCSWSSPST